jgi:hypothetical protein
MYLENGVVRQRAPINPATSMQRLGTGAAPVLPPAPTGAGVATGPLPPPTGAAARGPVARMGEIPVAGTNVPSGPAPGSATPALAQPGVAPTRSPTLGGATAGIPAPGQPARSSPSVRFGVAPRPARTSEGHDAIVSGVSPELVAMLVAMEMRLSASIDQRVSAFQTAIDAIKVSDRMYATTPAAYMPASRTAAGGSSTGSGGSYLAKLRAVMASKIMDPSCLELIKQNNPDSYPAIYKKRMFMLWGPLVQVIIRDLEA